MSKYMKSSNDPGITRADIIFYNASNHLANKYSLKVYLLIFDTLSVFMKERVRESNPFLSRKLKDTEDIEACKFMILALEDQ